MRAASISTGLMIMTRGYTTAGDGDWGVYYIKPPQAFDNIIDHELANGNVAVLQRLSADNVSNTAAGIITSTIQQDVNDELAGFIQTLQNYTAQDLYVHTSTHNITVDSDYSLTSAQNLSGIIIITDTSVILTTGRNIVVADTQRLFIAQNDTAQTLTFKTAAGSGIAVLAGSRKLLMCDGTNVINLAPLPLLHVQDQKTSGTNGGSSSAGVNIRAINTILTNEISGASLGSNQITLSAGTYEVVASAPARGSQNHKVYLYDTTGAIDLLIGSSADTSTDPSYRVQTTSVVQGRFTLSTTSVLELRHYITAALATSGLGAAVSSGQVEVYADVQIRKVS